MTRRSKHRIHLVSLGCPKNLVDSERMLSLVGGHDYEVTADPEDADVVIVNTCGFIGPAKEESIDAVMEADRLRRDGGKCKGIIVTGCLAQRYEKELKSELPEADLILNLSQEREIVRHIDELLGRTRATYLDSIPRVTMTPDHWAYLRISDGCDHKCAFCAIPLIKGRNKSEPIEVLVAEAEHLATAGVREFVLVAQDSLRYGKDLYGEIRLVPLLEKLAAVEGIQWVRLMYTYPAFWSDELLEFYADSDKMCRYVDMPLQHIADPVLVRMKRATTKKRTLDLLDRLRKLMPGVGLRSSFIVGFPGETEALFEELLHFVEDTRFDTATCFMYSPEDGTAASELDAPVSASITAERFRRLTELQDRISTEINDGLVGTLQTVLVDGPATAGRPAEAGEGGRGDTTLPGYWGRMERDAPEIDGQVFLEAAEAGEGGNELGPGRFTEAEITGATSYELTARSTGKIW